MMKRRGFLEILGSSAGSAWLAANAPALLQAGKRAATIPSTAAWTNLTSEEASLFDAVSAQIVPSDGTPGAREAHVTRFLDQAMSTIMKDDKADIKKGLGVFR